MKDVNKVILMGRLGSDPEKKTTPGGHTYTRFSLATHKMIKGRDELTQWHRIVAWGKVAEHCATYLRKGQAIYLKGEFRYSTYKDKEGVERTSPEVVLHEVSFLGGAPTRPTEPSHPTSQLEVQ